MKKFIIYKYSKNTQEIDKKITKNIDRRFLQWIKKKF